MNAGANENEFRATSGRRLSTVVVVNDAAHISGGSAKVALSSAVGLARAGYAVDFFAAKGPVAEELSAEPGIRVVCLGQDDILTDPSRVRAATRGIWNVPAQRAFERLLDGRDARSTVVHVHGWTKALSSSVVRAALQRSFPLVITLHDYFIVCPIGSLYRHRRQAICTIPPMSLRCVAENCDPRNYVQKLWRVARQAVQATAGIPGKKLRHVIAISDLSAAVLAPQLHAQTIVHRLPNPIDAGDAVAADVATNDEFLYVGRLSPEKGAQLFAGAAKEAGVRAVFVGDGECADQVRALNPDAEITGWLPHAAVQQRLNRARAVILPSLWYENAPLVVLEAAARGVPAVVADTCAAREDVVEGKTGVTFRSGDHDDLVRQLRRMADRAYATELGAAAFRRYWSAPRDLERHVAGLLAVYRAMLAEQEVRVAV